MTSVIFGCPTGMRQSRGMQWASLQIKPALGRAYQVSQDRQCWPSPSSQRYWGLLLFCAVLCVAPAGSTEWLQPFCLNRTGCSEHGNCTYNTNCTCDDGYSGTRCADSDSKSPYLALLFAVLGGFFMGTYPVPIKAKSVVGADVHPIIFQCYKSIWVRSLLRPCFPDFTE